MTHDKISEIINNAFDYSNILIKEEKNIDKIVNECSSNDKNICLVDDDLLHYFFKKDEESGFSITFAKNYKDKTFELSILKNNSDEFKSLLKINMVDDPSMKIAISDNSSDLILAIKVIEKRNEEIKESLKASIENKKSSKRKLK